MQPSQKPCRNLTLPNTISCIQVREGLVPLLAAVRERGTPPDTSCIAGTFDTATQAKLSHEIALDLGFDTEHGRLDVSVHPFTGGANPHTITA